MKSSTLATLGMVAFVAACTDPQPRVMYAEPTFDKFGVPDCRPGDMPISEVYPASLPICPIISEYREGDNVGTSSARTKTAPTSPTTPTTTVSGQTRNQQQTSTENQKRNTANSGG